MENIFFSSAWVTPAWQRAEWVKELLLATEVAGEAQDEGDAENTTTIIDPDLMATSEYRLEFVLFCAFFVFVVIILWLPGFIKHTVLRKETGPIKKARTKTSSYTNYIYFSKVCQRMFVFLTFTTFIITLPGIHIWGWGPVCSGFLNARVSLVNHTSYKERGEIEITDTHYAVVLILTLVNGTIMLGSAWTLQSQLPGASVLAPRTAETLDRTLWLKWLPTQDTRRGVPFKLDDEEFERVGADLAEALEQQVAGQAKMFGHKVDQDIQHSIKVHRHVNISAGSKGSQTQHVEKLVVVPVVDEWRAASLALRDSTERATAYLDLAETTCLPWRRWQYIRASDSYRTAAFKLRGTLLNIQLGNKKIAGCAFVTFKDKNSRDRVINQESHSLWNIRIFDIKRMVLGFSTFTFGYPPFASVTLKCVPAPHPDDITWENIHIGELTRTWRRRSMLVLLFLILLVVVNPTVIGAGIDYALGEGGLEDDIVRWSNYTASRGWDSMSATILSMKSFTEDLTPLILLGINAGLLPIAIEMIAGHERSRQYSIYEQRQLELNFIFLMGNTFFAQVSSDATIMTIVNKFWERYSGDFNILNSTGISTEVGDAYLGMSGYPYLRYILSAALISNASLLLSKHKYTVLKWLYLSMAVTERDIEEASEPPLWPWGYWYAWALSVMAIALFTSTVVPGTLPMAALFFWVKKKVDAYNLGSEVFNHGHENLGVFTVTVVWHMELIVGCFWILMSFVLYHMALKLKLAEYARVGLPIGVMTLAFYVLVQGWSQQLLETWHLAMKSSKRAARGGGRQWIATQMSKSILLPFDMERFKKRSTTHEDSINWDVRERHEFLFNDPYVDAVLNFFHTNHESPWRLEHAHEQLQAGFDGNTSEMVLQNVLGNDQEMATVRQNSIDSASTVATGRSSLGSWTSGLSGDTFATLASKHAKDPSYSEGISL